MGVSNVTLALIFIKSGRGDSDDGGGGGGCDGDGETYVPALSVCLHVAIREVSQGNTITSTSPGGLRRGWVGIWAEEGRGEKRRGAERRGEERGTPTGKMLALGQGDVFSLAVG